MYHPGGAILPLGGAVTVNAPVPAVNDVPTKRWSMLNAWVTEPLRTRTTEEILAASGVCTVNAFPQEIELGALVIEGRVATPPLELNKYAGL